MAGGNEGSVRATNLGVSWLFSDCHHPCRFGNNRVYLLSYIYIFMSLQV